MKDYIDEVSLRPMPEEKQKIVAEWAMRKAKRLRLWKEDGKQMIWCDQCQRYEEISPEMLKQVKKSRVCPMCYRESEGTSTVDIMDHCYVEYDSCGYDVWFKWQRGKLEVMSAEQVAYWGDHEYVSGIVRTMSYCIGRTENTRWRKVRNYGPYWTYYGDFYGCSYIEEDGKTDRIWDTIVTTKREYYNYISQGLNLKSNQIKFISEGLFSRSQLEYIEAFDLKSRAQVYKYAKYIRENPIFDGIYVQVHLNPTYLDYLWRNGIRVRDYCDYMRCCQVIHRKIDKPRDFKHWHDQVTEAVEMIKHEDVIKMIPERAKALKHYEKDGVVMNPIESYQQCIDIGKELHNCIRTYADGYAKGRCELYYISDNGKIVVAIEARGGIVYQARTDHNKDMPKKYEKILDQCFGKIVAY